MGKIFKAMVVFAVLVIGLSFMMTAPAWGDGIDRDNAVCSKENTNIPDAVKDAAGCNSETKDKLPDVVTNIANTVIGTLGIVATIMIIAGGVQYMTSAGDAGKVKKAKETIIYAVIGLVICALAATIVNFAITGVNNASGGEEVVPPSTSPGADSDSGGNSEEGGE